MDYYNRQDGLKYILQRRKNGFSPIKNRQEFPKPGLDYVAIFHSIEEEMNKSYHPNVNLGAAINGDGLLTDHGVEHVQDVIRHAGDITEINQLTGYEIFILLLAIHFHDVGNIAGRDNHEKRIAEIIDEMDNKLPLSTPEKQFICDIATAHGGYFGEDKDTIKHITADDMYANVRIRPKVLAAILRFADEISDDFSRTVTPVDIPKANEIYHEYSRSLDPISVIGDTIKFHYRIPISLTQKKIGKDNDEVFLYDEILGRLAKCMRELEYCKKYSNGLIKPNSLSVIIDFKEDNSFRIRQGAGDRFKLSLQGYPDSSIHRLSTYMELQNDSAHSVKPLRYKDGNELSQIKWEE